MVRDEMPAWRRRQPAFDFSRPRNLIELSAHRGRARFAGGKIQQVHLLQRSAVPPGRQTKSSGFGGLEINPDAVAVNRRR